MDQDFQDRAGRAPKKDFVDNSFITGDPRKVELDDSTEIAYWVKALGTTVERLAAAVATVGNSAQAIKEFLAETRFGSND